MNPQGRLDGSVGALDHAVGLRVIGTSGRGSDAQETAEGGEQGGHELCAAVRHNLVRTAETLYPLCAKGSGDGSAADVLEGVAFEPPCGAIHTRQEILLLVLNL